MNSNKMSLSDLIRPEICNLPNYNAGLALEQFRATYGLDCIAKLDSNENPLGTSSVAIKAMQEAATGVARYPGAANVKLRTKIAKAVNIDAENVVIGNGSEDLIGALFRATLRPNDRVVTICPSFGLHEFGAMACGATVTKVTFEKDWSFPIDGLRDALSSPTRILIFSSPSNPAGPAMTESSFRAVLNAADDATLIVYDEAYLEFIDADNRFDALTILAKATQPWISLRTFSKAYGFAGVRVGYGLTSSQDLAKALMKTRNPFGVNALALEAAIAAMDDTDHLNKTVALAIHERERVTEALQAKGYQCAPSQANFVFFDTGNPSADLVETLRHKGILIKGWQEVPFLNWARVTMGSTKQNDTFLSALPSRLANT